MCFTFDWLRKRSNACLPKAIGREERRTLFFCSDSIRLSAVRSYHIIEDSFAHSKTNKRWPWQWRREMATIIWWSECSYSSLCPMLGQWALDFIALFYVQPGEDRIRVMPLLLPVFGMTSYYIWRRVVFVKNGLALCHNSYRFGEGHFWRSVLNRSCKWALAARSSIAGRMNIPFYYM